MSSSQNKHEIVIALVAPIGVNVAKAKEQLEMCLKKYHYDVNSIAVTALASIEMQSDDKDICRAQLDAESINMPDKRKIFAGLNELDDGGITTCDIYPYLIVEKIKSLRKADGPTQVYILDNLKNPHEIESLRRVYKKALFVVGLTATMFERISNKIEIDSSGIDSSNNKKFKNQEITRAISEILQDYRKPINFDENLNNETSAAYQLSDIFINFDSSQSDDDNPDQNIERFVDLICGAPIITPTAHEHNMFMAYMSSIRSADLSRQVGSTIVNQDDDILAMGANEVPSPDGGQYWSDVKYIPHLREDDEV
jgi:deoxycytidylate deaminase